MPQIFNTATLYQNLLTHCPAKLDFSKTYNVVIRRYNKGFYFNKPSPGAAYFPAYFAVRSEGIRKYIVDKEPEEQKALLRKLLRELCFNPYDVICEYGHTTGICAMCGAELTNEESKRLGIGPVCRKKLSTVIPLSQLDLF